LSDIAGATGMPAEFLSGAAIDLLEEDRIFFRARRRSPSALLHRSAAFGSLGIGFYDSIRRRFRTPAPSVPEAEPGDSPREAARALRLAWRMGAGPAPNLVQLAEAHGIRVLGIPLADAVVDAFSFWAPDGRPFVFLSRIKTAERSRFDLAHEIGHLVLHCDVTGTGETTDREIEREADVFASANEKQMKYPKATDLDSVIVEKIHLRKRTVEQYWFDHQEGKWKLNKICTIGFKQSYNASFFTFLSRFFADSGRGFVKNPLAYSGPDPNGEEVATINTTIPAGEWSSFLPEVPGEMIYNILYGQKYSESDRKILTFRGLANGAETQLFFRRHGKDWRLEKIVAY